MYKYCIPLFLLLFASFASLGQKVSEADLINMALKNSRNLLLQINSNRRVGRDSFCGDDVRYAWEHGSSVLRRWRGG